MKLILKDGWYGYRCQMCNRFVEVHEDGKPQEAKPILKRGLVLCRNCYEKWHDQEQGIYEWDGETAY